MGEALRLVRDALGMTLIEWGARLLSDEMRAALRRRLEG